MRRQLDVARRIVWSLRERSALVTFGVSLAQKKRQSELGGRLRPGRSAITLEAYREAEAKARKRKELASFLGVSLTAVREFEQRQGIERKKMDKLTG